MIRQASQLEFVMDATFVPMPEEHVEAWRAGILLLLNILKDGDLICARGASSVEVHNAIMDDDRNGDAVGSIPALLPIQVVIEG
jgi:hypothetical protein